MYGVYLPVSLSFSFQEGNHCMKIKGDKTKNVLITITIIIALTNSVQIDVSGNGDTH